MKNIKIFIPILLLTVFISCSDNVLYENLYKEVEVNESEEINELVELEARQKKIKIKLLFRHFCVHKGGICLQINFRLSPLTEAEFEEGFGTAYSSLEKDKLTLSFDRSIASKENPIVDIYGDWDLGKEYSKALGVNSIKIKKGLYNVDYSENLHGKAVFDVIIN